MTRGKDKHLEREEILDAIAKGEKPSVGHLRECPDCLSLYETLLHFDGAADVVLEDPSAHLIEKLTAIPQLVGSRPARVKVRGRIVYDSWIDLPAAQLRDSGTVRERRMRFAYGNIGLEIVAERHTDGWEFTARVYDGETTTCKYVLKVGRERFAPEMHDCYYFKRPTLPRTLYLLSPDQQIVFGLAGSDPEVKK